jgi:hypothetical protein
MNFDDPFIAHDKLSCLTSARARLRASGCFVLLGALFYRDSNRVSEASQVRGSQTTGAHHFVVQQDGLTAATRTSFASCWKKELTRDYEGRIIAMRQG